MPLRNGNRLLAEMQGSLHASVDPDEFHRSLLVGLRDLIGCDGAAFRPGGRWIGSRAHYLDEDTRFTDGYIRKAEVYRPEVAQWCDLSKGDRAFIDTEVYSTSERRKKAL